VRRGAAGLALASLLLSGAGCRTFGPSAPPAPEAAPRPAVVLLSSPVDVERGFGAWRNRVRAAGVDLVRADAMPPEGYNECAETAQLPGVYVCLSFFAVDMNRILGRASVYAEGGFSVPRGTFAKDTDPDVRKLNVLIEGQDLKSEDLLPYFATVRARCAAGEKALCLNPSESQFYERVFAPIAARYKKFVILGVAAQSFDSYQSNLGHEVIHAQYMLQPHFKDEIDRFWAALPDADKAAIRKILAANAYDPHDEFLMINEFQAYLLEPEADDDLLRDFVPKYRAAATQALARAGLSPLQVR
jgi:hypothetical protein